MDGPGGLSSPLFGYSIVAVGAVDLLLALFFAFARPPADPRARRNLPMLLGISGVVMVGFGAAILLGVFAREG